jgi:hypothetical protein
MQLSPPLASGIVERPTADGQILFGNNTTGKWVHSETSEIVWDDTNKRLGIGVASPARTLDVLDTSEQVRLSYSGAVYMDMKCDSNGDGILTPTGSTLELISSGYPRLSTYNYGSEIIIDPNEGSARAVFGAYEINNYPWAFFGNNLKVNADIEQIDDSYSGWGFVFDARASYDMFKIMYRGSNGTDNKTKFAIGADGDAYFGDSISVTPTVASSDMFFDGTNKRLGIGKTTIPNRRLEALDGTNPQIRGTHTDGTHYWELQADSNGYMKVITSGGGYGIDVAPTAVQTGYTTPTNLTTDRTFDADSTTVAELADVLGTLIEDLKAKGIISA